jgi:hypothetical protein
MAAVAVILSTLSLQRPAVLPRTTTQPQRARTAVMASWTPADMKAKRVKLPAEVDGLLSLDTSRENVEALWGALRRCFATEGDAIAAAKRNTGTILPYLNSPSNIAGSYDVLVDMLGTEGARDVCMKNPGILQCNPKILAREDADNIVNTADQVDFFEVRLLGSLPPAVRQNLDKIAFLVLALPIAKRLSDCAGQTCGL